MPQAAPARPCQDDTDRQQAIELLRSGDVHAGSRLLGEVALRTTDPEVRSHCLFNLAEILEKLGRPKQAYETWYDLAHKPPAKLNAFDLQARLQVMKMFEQRALAFTPPDFPPKLQIEVTNRCNLRCIMCTRNQMTRPQGDLTFEAFQKVADDWSIEPWCTLILYYLGEPLLHKELERMIAYARSVEHRSPAPGPVGIQTNGMLLTADRARSLLDAGLRHFAFSVDGLEGDLERIRPGASYPQVEGNILGLARIARELGIEDLQIEISKLCDDPEADEVKRFLARWRDKAHFVHLLGITRVAGNAYMAADGSIKPIDQTRRAAAKRYCRQGQRLLVHADGSYGFCCGDVNGGLDLGSVWDRSVREVWNSPEIQAIRRKVAAADYEGLTPCLSCVHSGGPLSAPASSTSV
jgi:sulfatase maturation enzyme AslB (radical SAM superfamily)